MYVLSGEIGFKVYWEDMSGKRQPLFTSALNKEQAISEAEEYIREKIYMASFRIVGLEQMVNRRWEKVNIATKYCQGRA